MGNKLSPEDFLRILNDAGIYTIDQLQTSGQSSVHWDNITNKEEYVNSFISLTDTESSYVGKAGYKIIVNPTATGLIFTPDTTDGTDGTDGREIELQNNGTYIQWRYIDTPALSWTNLVAIADITGDDGTDGTDGVSVESAVINGSNELVFTLSDASTINVGVVVGTDGSDGSDGKSLHLLAVDPTTEGNDGDTAWNYTSGDIFLKESGTWNLKGNVNGTDGVDGIDGDQWFYSSGAPTDFVEKTYDSYHLNTTTGVVSYKLENTTSWTAIFTITGSKYLSTSTTTLDMSTFAVGEDITLTVDAGMSYSIGQILVVSSSTSLYFYGRVKSYTSTTLVITLTYKVGSTSSSAWTVNLGGIVEAESKTDWYEITATAGTGAATTRTFTGPSGWTIDTSDVIAHADLGTNSVDITIEHNTGYKCIEAVVFTTSGSINTKLQGSAAYTTLRENTSHTAVEIIGLATIAQPLIIYLKLV